MVFETDISKDMQNIVNEFVDSIDCMRSIFDSFNHCLGKTQSDVTKKFKDKYSPYEIQNKKNKDISTYKIADLGLSIEINRDFKKLQRLQLANKFMPRSGIINLINVYDKLISRLMRVVYIYRPQMIKDSDKKLSISEILEIGSIEDVRESIIEKEVDEILRGDHFSHFDWFSDRSLGSEYDKKDEVKKFIEITQRRNLFVHADGVVNKQYLNGCKKHGADVGDAKLGDVLEVDHDYYIFACNTVWEVGLKLCITVWMKLAKSEKCDILSFFNEKCLDIISEKQYMTAISMINFLEYGLKKCSGNREELELYLKINKAQAFKWNKEETKCKQIIDSISWSTRDNRFLLVKSVLMDDFEEAYHLMEKIGDDNRIGEIGYRQWPIFKEIRKQTRFKEVYDRIFDTPFSEVTPQLYEGIAIGVLHKTPIEQVPARKLTTSTVVKKVSNNQRPKKKRKR